MSKKVKLVTSLAHRAERTVNIKGVSISFDAKLQTEISEDHVETIMKADPSLSLVDKKKNTDKVKDKDPVDPKKNKDTDTSKAEDTDKDDEFGLKTMTFEELKEMASNAELPEAEWNELDQEKLVEYLTTKL
jgi:hypothetical protein